MPNQLKIGALRPNLSTGYIGFYPSFQTGDTQLTDQSGKGNHATFGADLTASVAWTTTANRYSTTEDVTGTKAIAAQLAIGTGLQFAPATESLLIFGVVAMAAPAGTRSLLGVSVGTPNPGFGLRVLSTGKARLDICRAGADVLLNASTGTVADGTRHSVAIAFDGSTKRAFLWVDGAADSAYGGGTDISAYTDWYPFTRSFAIGGVGHNGAKVISCAQSSFGWHLLKRTGGLPSNINDIVARLHANPVVPLTAAEWA